LLTGCRGRHRNVGVWRLFLLQASFQAIHAFQQCFEDICFGPSLFGNGILSLSARDSKRKGEKVVLPYTHGH
jgi:hypothetical protein